MVNYKRKSAQRQTDNQAAPPPMDESWWEAVLAEDTAHRTQKTAPPPKTGFIATAEPPIAMDTNTAAQSLPEVQDFDDRDTEPLDWENAASLYEQDQVVELNVIGYNRGGLLVNGAGLQGFVPISHLVDAPCSDTNPEEWLASFTEQTLHLKVIECDQERGRIVFSERAAQAQPGTRRRLLESLQPGDCIQGIVTNITDFGIFVDLGGVEGLVHVSEISWGRVHHPADVVSLNQQVEAHVIHVDQDKARIALSLKRLRPNPWQTAEERYYPGQITQAIVTSIVPFGAFARLEEGLDGLIHVSEMGQPEMTASGRSLCEGQEIQVRILHVDASRQRLGLSLKI